jgi:hypothetical protein
MHVRMLLLRLGGKKGDCEQCCGQSEAG